MVMVMYGKIMWMTSRMTMAKCITMLTGNDRDNDEVDVATADID